MNEDDKIYVAGHRGLVGSAILRRLENQGFENILVRNRSELDLCSQSEVDLFFLEERPAYVFLAAAKVGGIHANNEYPADFIRDNLQIQMNVIDAAYKHGAKKLLLLGSSCIYPREAPQPIKEESLLTGPLEETNQWYALAKIAGIKMCQAYRKQYGFDAISIMPTNLYGPGDNFHPENSHVLPALIRRFHEAKINGAQSVQIWGTGKPMREFLYVDDLAEACEFAMNEYSDSDAINVGVGKDISIKNLAILVKDIVQYNGDLAFDTSKPDGTPRKVMDVSRATNLGWSAKTSLQEGISRTYDWYLSNLEAIRT